MSYRRFVLPLTLALLGCGGSPSPAANGPEATEIAATESQPEPEPTSPPKSRGEQCEDLGNAIESGILGGSSIVNLNDQARLEKLAGDWKAAAERVDAVQASDPELVELRKEFLSLARGMADALAITVGAGAREEKHKALERYNELDGKTEALVERFNQACGGGQPAQP